MKERKEPSRGPHTRAARKHFSLLRALAILIDNGASDAAVADTARLSNTARLKWQRASATYRRLDEPFRKIRNAEWEARMADAK